MELKTNASVSFTWALLAYWIQILSSTDQNGEDWGKRIRNWKQLATFSCLDVVNSKNSPNVNMDNFSWQNSFDFAFLVYKECRIFWNNYQVWFFYQLWPENSKTTVTLPLYFHNNHILRVDIAIHSNGGTPFFDVTLTIDRFLSNAKVTFTKSLRKCELTLRISKASQVSLQFSFAFVSVHKSIKSWRRNVRLYHFFRRVSPVYSRESLLQFAAHCLKSWLFDVSCTISGVHTNNSGEHDFSVRSELLISEVNFLLFLLLVWLFGLYLTHIERAKGFKARKKMQGRDFLGKKQGWRRLVVCSVLLFSLGSHLDFYHL